MSYVDHYVSQFAGEIGLISFGLGREFSRYSISGMYGVVPVEYHHGPLIETVTIRQTYTFYNWKQIDLHAGLNVFHVLSLKYHSQRFRDSAKGYYPIGSIRALLNLGVSVSLNKAESRSVYFEAGINDIWIVNWMNNSSVINPFEYGVLAVGFKQKF